MNKNTSRLRSFTAAVRPIPTVHEFNRSDCLCTGIGRFGSLMFYQCISFICFISFISVFKEARGICVSRTAERCASEFGSTFLFFAIDLTGFLKLLFRIEFFKNLLSLIVIGCFFLLVYDFLFVSAH